MNITSTNLCFYPMVYLTTQNITNPLAHLATLHLKS